MVQGVKEWFLATSTTNVETGTVPTIFTQRRGEWRDESRDGDLLILRVLSAST